MNKNDCKKCDGNIFECECKERSNQSFRHWFQDFRFIIKNIIFHGNLVIFKNKGCIQFKDLTYIHRTGWFEYLSIKEIEELSKELKN